MFDNYFLQKETIISDVSQINLSKVANKTSLNNICLQAEQLLFRCHLQDAQIWDTSCRQYLLIHENLNSN